MRTDLHFFALLAIALLGLAVPGAQAASKPNVLFIAVDDLRPELGCYGHAHVKSPNIDRIARNGIVFNRAYCQQAVCSPSRSSLMTGTRPDTTRVWDLETHFRKALPDVVTLGQHFKNNGWFVQGMGKIFHGGFDDAPTWSVPWDKPKAESYGRPETLELVKRKLTAAKAAGTSTSAHAAQRSKSSDVPDNTFHDGALAEMAVNALRERKAKGDPFFLAVGFIRPHLPFVSPQKYWNLYDPAAIQLAPNPFRATGSPSYAVGDGGEMRSYHDIPDGHIPDDLARQLKRAYYAAISYMDAQVGQVLDELQRLGLADNTIVILWGDHGWKLGEHDAWCKHTNVELDTNAPLIISVPGLESAGQHTDALVEFVDIYPSLAELAGLPLPAHLEGTSFVPVLRDPARPWKIAAFSQYPRTDKAKRLMGYSMRTDRYRFTAWVDRADHSRVDAIELYDHRNDPQENTNMADEPENAKLVADLTTQWRQGWHGAQPAKNH